MLNIEKHQKEFFEKIWLSYFAVSRKENKVAECDGFNCMECLFYKDKDKDNIDATECELSRIKWLLEEYKIQPKLTRRERAFCELCETGWLARDTSDYYETLFYYTVKPHLEETRWLSKGLQFNFRIEFKGWEKFFPFIILESGKAWAIEELLELEVEET